VLKESQQIALEDIKQTMRAEYRELSARLDKLTTSSYFEKVTPIMDMKTESIRKATITNTEILTDKGIDEWNGFFLEHKLQNRCYFQLEILEMKSSYFALGIAAE